MTRNYPHFRGEVPLGRDRGVHIDLQCSQITLLTIVPLYRSTIMSPRSYLNEYLFLIKDITNEPEYRDMRKCKKK